MMNNQKKQPSSYYHNKFSKKRLVINQGGTRSGKTYSILQVLAEYCLFNKDAGAVITVVRKTSPSLRATAYRDFLQILDNEGWYSEALHNKTEMNYWLFGNLVEFISLDDPQKIRGRKRNVCFINEANELDKEDYIQLNIRTTDKMILDYNPSDEYHWIYDDLINEKCEFYVTTYLDNPFLPKEMIEVIEDLKSADENHWRIYGLGQRGMSSETIYTHWRLSKGMPMRGEQFYGLDFGFNVQTALILCEEYEKNLYAHEVIYETKLTTNELIDKMKSIGISKNLPIYCDNAEPDRIQELCNANYNAIPAEKSVTAGIDSIKGRPLFITQESTNLLKEIRNYKWMMDKNGKVKQPEQPVKFNDHLMDAMRYAIFSRIAEPSVNWYAQ